MPYVYAKLYYHFVWITANRIPVLEGDVESLVYRIILSWCKRRDCEVIAIGGTPDHIHIIVSLPDTMSPREFIDSIQSCTLRPIHHNPNLDMPRFHWADAFGAQTVSPSELKEVAHYVKNQMEQHATGRIWEQMERAGRRGD